MLCGWEGNRRSGVVMASCYRLGGLSTYELNGQCVGDEHPTYASGHGPLYLYLTFPLWTLHVRFNCHVLYFNTAYFIEYDDQHIASTFV